MLLLSDSALEDRRRAARGPLAPLYDGLSGELEPFLGRDPFVPRDKALLTRKGGRCDRDGAILEFEPTVPESHTCPACGTVHSGAAHRRAWVTWYQLWLAERAVHAALFHAFRGERRHAAHAQAILLKLADAYADYPNRDNVLGPSRPFFSTYLESIWLLQVCVAADLLAAAGDTTTPGVVRDRIVLPSAALIAGFDERMSNRQVWNNVALLASALLLDDARSVDSIVNGPSGLLAHLGRGLLADGTWYEGDNYHQFAIRGLWYAVTMCDANGIRLPQAAVDAFDRGVVGTYRSALPDFTFPSRKDSQYAVSLRQWRFAELAELGFARRQGDELSDALARCYADDIDRRPTGRARSTADAERNEPASALARDDLGWRALLHALPELPPVSRRNGRSVHLAGQGLAIFRRDNDVFAALDYGQAGAGHGHPDRLNLLLSHGEARWLDDLGTGSYVDPSLHWYRSTLAHNAPLIDGRSQPRVDGVLGAWEELGDFGWVDASCEIDGVRLQRTVVVAREYLVEELTWEASRGVRVELPWHFDGRQDSPMSPATVDGGDGLEDGFSFVRGGESLAMAARETVHLSARRGRRAAALTLESDGPATLLRTRAPGQPAAEERPFYIVRADRASGRMRAVLAWREGVEPRFSDAGTIVDIGAQRHAHRRVDTGWLVDVSGELSRRVELKGRVARPAPPQVPRSRPPTAVVRRVSPTRGWWSELNGSAQAGAFTMRLAEPNYRQSELPWRDAGSPTATVAVVAAVETLTLFVDVHTKERNFMPASAVNEFDNEHPDTLGSGIQLYVNLEGGRGMWMLVPESGGDAVRVRPIAGSAMMAPPTARWRETSAGYEVRVDLPIPAVARLAAIDLVINDAAEGRERRQGQLVTADVRGEFVYLRGDREEPDRAVVLELTT